MYESLLSLSAGIRIFSGDSNHYGSDCTWISDLELDSSICPADKESHWQGRMPEEIRSQTRKGRENVELGRQVLLAWFSDAK